MYYYSESQIYVTYCGSKKRAGIGVEPHRHSRTHRISHRVLEIIINNEYPFVSLIISFKVRKLVSESKKTTAF